MQDAVTEPSTEAARQLTCFVVTGFGKKTDYVTGRVLNLDQTFRQLVQPACDRVDVNCFRAIDANLTGQIDSIMYRWIFEADLVIADLSTLNANVFYELGVRHAQRPNTTVLIAESLLLERIPFDLSSFVIHQYEHGGEEIGAPEQERFVSYLSELLDKIIGVEMSRRKSSPELPPESDSPIYRNLKGMKPPEYAPESYLEPPAYIPPEDRDQPPAADGATLADLLRSAESAMAEKRFEDAIGLLDRLVQSQTEGASGGKPDVYIVQKLALATYKAGERTGSSGTADPDRAIAALYQAEEILETHCAPGITNDPETLGLAGAINKRLFELTDDMEFLDRAIRFYERGFYIKQDYYNGINVAFMYSLRATRLEPGFDATVSYGHANMIRAQVARICEDLVSDEEGLASRGDREWIYLTLAEAYLGMGRSGDAERIERKIERQISDFAKASYQEQKAKLLAIMELFEDGAKGSPAGQSFDSVSVRPLATLQENGLVSFRPDIATDRQVRSLEVTYRIDYD